MKDQVRTPLRTVLRNFLNHIENLESSSSPENSYDAEFQDLKLFSESVKTTKEFACTEGEKEINKKKNRYKDILPFDVSRVILNEYAGIPGSDYINANYIKGASGSLAYIASQGPLPCTVNDFWRMVVQCEVQVIVMACNEEEAGKAKCEKYWVDEGEEKQFGMISVKLLKASTVCPDFSVRTMRLKYTNNQNVIEERTVCQLHYVAWPDHGVPTVVQPLLQMVRLVRDTQASETLPVLVHCSAGCGRTGTICAIDYVWGLLRTGKLTDDFSLLSLIREMRKQRIAMVQTKEQYVLVHQAVRELFKEQLLMIDSHPYENVDPDGLLIMKEEENDYDTVENFANLNVDEKKDNTMEKDVAPPLPQKKLTLYPSKQDKDVENLSAQQRSITLSTRNASQMVSSHSARVNPADENPLIMSQALQKKLPNPIPSKGILRVPHLKSISLASPIKRSKSLKLSNSAIKLKMVLSPTPTELKRRGSLESNIDETGSILDDGSHLTSYVEDPPSSKDNSSTSAQNSPQTVQKYDILNHLVDRRLFVRSLTTYDMRQNSKGPNVLPAERPVGNTHVNRCKLSRSNTQIDFSRHLGRRTSNRIDFDESNTNSPPMHYNSVEQSAAVMSNRESSKAKLTDKLYKSSTKIMDDVNNFRPVDSDQSKHQSVSRKESPNLNHSSRIEMPLHVLVQPLDSGNGDVGKRNLRDHQVPPNFRQLSGNAYRYHDTKMRKLPDDGKTHRFVYSDSKPSTSCNWHKFKPPLTNKTAEHQLYHNVAPVNSAQAFSYLSRSPMTDPVKFDARTGKPSNYSDGKPVYQPRSLIGKDGVGPILKKPNVTGSTVYREMNRASSSNHKVLPSPRNAFQDPNFKKQLGHNNARHITNNGMYYPRESEDRFGIEKTSVQSSSPIRASLDTEQSNPKMAGTPAGRIWPPPYQLTELTVDRTAVDVNDDNHKMHSELPAQKPPGPASSKLDITPSSESSIKSDYFSNAPGVDLDQVAASIPQKDATKTNLMKVALEAFNIRRSRHQARLPDSSPSTSSSSKGSSPSSTMGGSKRRQQQYL